MLRVQGLMGRASTWAPGGMPSGAWSPDMLAGLYYNWNMGPQQPVSHPTALPVQQDVAATAFQQGALGSSGATGDWRSVVQAAAAAASQLEISKLSGSKSLRSADLEDNAPLATPSASLGKAQTAAKFCAAQLPARFSKVSYIASLLLHT